jgi:hypothetical protein
MSGAKGTMATADDVKRPPTAQITKWESERENRPYLFTAAAFRQILTVGR